MIEHAFNVVVDSQHGSTGKGAISSYLAWKYRPEFISSTNMANAGHTAVNTNGEKFISKAFPAPAILNAWVPDYNPTVVLGPTAAFTIPQLLKEQGACQLKPGQLVIHERAGVITDKHKAIEAEETKHIASTMQGCGALLAEKIKRGTDVSLARTYDDLRELLCTNWTKYGDIGLSGTLGYKLNKLISCGYTFLHEGSQGFSLCINHGSHYPQCTSRSTTAIQNLADMGISPKHLGDIYMVLRPYPIRVGNVVENGSIVGYSGDCYPDNHEITWDEVAKNAGAPLEIAKGELTTVTFRTRRVFSFSKIQLREAAVINGATKLALNFANYIDWSCNCSNDPEKLSNKVMDFIKMIEDLTSIPVALVGTGPQLNHVIEL